MAKKKRRRRPASAQPAASPRPAPTTEARRDRKEAKRQDRERAAKAEVRRGALRRGLIGGLVGLLVFFAISWFNRAPAAKPLSGAAIDAAATAGCAGPIQPDPDPQRLHLAPGEAHTYTGHPATSGVHDPTPLPDTPRVYTAAEIGTYRETAAVHSLEHGSVIMYYRPSGEPDGLPRGVVDQLAPIATGSHATYLIPYADLPTGTALAYTAWNQLLTCPADITADQAVTIAQGFVDSFACTRNAPEGKNGPGC